MKKKIQKIIEKRKENLAARLENDNAESEHPMFDPTDVTYDMSGKISAIHCGGIGLVRQLVNTLGLPRLLDERLELLKRHKPYHDSDHILNMAYNIICGGKNLEDLELLRNNPAYLDALGTPRIPDPTTAGDFLRRFSESDILAFMECMNEVSVGVIKRALPKKARQVGIIDVDGTIQETYGECKEGMDMSYKGLWGFSALSLMEATSGVHLFTINRPGNKPSQDNAAPWMNMAIATVKRAFKRVIMRGDTAFSLTGEFDDWDTNGVGFIFGWDAHKNMKEMADLLPEKAWHEVARPVRPIKTKPRRKKSRVKAAVVKRRTYRNITLKKEWVSEFSYQPVKCKKSYRVVVLRKLIEESQGQQRLFECYRYFFYITNINDMSAPDLLRLIQKRCNHENKIEQLDNGIHALKMPAAEFLANWAYMAIATLAWNIKAWVGMMLPAKKKRHEIIACEFKSFQNQLINIPCQVLKTGRRMVLRFLNYNPWVEIIFTMVSALKRMRFSPG